MVAMSRVRELRRSIRSSAGALAVALAMGAPLVVGCGAQTRDTASGAGLSDAALDSAIAPRGDADAGGRADASMSPDGGVPSPGDTDAGARLDAAVGPPADSGDGGTDGGCDPRACPAPAGACAEPYCTPAGTCGERQKADGSPSSAQVPGDCTLAVCAGGSVTAQVDDTDLPDDGNECTGDSCVGGIPTHAVRPANAPCGTAGASFCDGAGTCAMCLTADQCPGSDTECRSRTCDLGVCGLATVAAGTPTAAQTVGDCRRVQCDGQGATETVADSADLPDDGNTCTTDACNGATPTHTPRPSGTACGVGLFCDGNGVCPACAAAADCSPPTNLCLVAVCASGNCGVVNALDGTVCDDADACTQTDTCQAGVCTGGTPVSCAAQDQCHVAGACSPATGVCSSPSKADGVSCNDGNACTQADTCQAGVCTGGTPVSCGPQFALTVTKDGNGSGDVTSSLAGIACGVDCTENYDASTTVTLSATPSPGSTFAGWSGACTGVGGCTVTMASARNVTATFTLETFTLKLTKSGDGDGTVTGNGIDCGATCSVTLNYGTTVVLTSTASTAGSTLSTFTAWSGADCSGTGQCSFTITSDSVVDAEYELRPNLMFTTSAIFNGVLGGLAGADAKCQALAQSKGLSGNYRAYLGATGVSAPSRFAGASGWTRVDGKAIVNAITEFGTTTLPNAPVLDEGGNDLTSSITVRVWTATTVSTSYFGQNCNNSGISADWNSTQVRTMSGLCTTTDVGVLTGGGVTPCATQLRLYCFGIDRAATVP